MQCECGRYAVIIATLPDGTNIYHCINCGKLWGERLVRFDVSFELVEKAGNGHGNGNERIPESVEIALSGRPPELTPA